MVEKSFYFFELCNRTFAFNVFENIAMTIGLMPLTGIALPFMSYGGSSVMGNMIAVGIVFACLEYDKSAV
ncbi:hypothetical protein GPZ05_14770 [Listeria monocytogenes]|nr:hypothetical protein [Listeria monocytogenes]EDN7515061.1 hypothetical protein [Listeria monocytogenes]